jgi:hypothetical protein
MTANIEATAGILASCHSDAASRVRIPRRPSPITVCEACPESAATVRERYSAELRDLPRRSWRYPTRSAGVPDAKVLVNATPVPVTRTSIPTAGFRLISIDQSSGNAADALRSSFSWSGRRMRNPIRMLAMVYFRGMCRPTASARSLGRHGLVKYSSTPASRARRRESPITER